MKKKKWNGSIMTQNILTKHMKLIVHYFCVHLTDIVNS